MVATQASALSTRQLKPSGGGILDRYIDFRANVATKGLPSLGFSSHRPAGDSARARPPSARHGGGGGMTATSTSRDLSPGMGMGMPMSGRGRLPPGHSPVGGGAVRHPGPQPAMPGGGGTVGASQKLQQHGQLSQRGGSLSQRVTSAFGFGKKDGSASHRAGDGASHRSNEGGQSTSRKLLGRITGGGSARQALPSVLAVSHRTTGTRDNNVRV